MADMSYENQLADLGSLDADGLGKLEAQVVKAFEDADANDDLEAMATSADALDQIHEAQITLSGQSTDSTEDLTTDGAEIDSAPDAAIAASADGPEDDDEEAEDEDESGDESEDGEPAPAGTPVAGADEVNDTIADAEAEAEAGDEGVTAGAEHRTRIKAKRKEMAKDAESTEQDDDADDAVVAAGLPDALKSHQFPKKGKKATDDADEDDPVTAAAEDAEDDEDAVTAASDQHNPSLEETTVPVEQKDIPTERQPIVAASQSVIVAGADIPLTAAGSEYESYREVNEAFVSRLDTLRNSRSGDGDKVIVASIKATVDPDRELFPGADADNFDKVEAVIKGMALVERGALVASGGYCAPLETRYDIFGVGVTDRPIRDSLAGFQATRGGIRYVQPPVLSSYSAAVGLWTAANDANPSAPATKPFLTAVCQSEITVTVDAITLEIQFGNLMTRAYPELVARNNELGLIYQARFAEQTLLNKISALSTAVTATWQLGTARDFLNSLGRLSAAYRTRHRLTPETPLRAIAPSWVLNAIREDLTRGSIAGGEPGMGVEWADSVINASLASRNINITWHLDDAAFTGVQNAGAINDFPASIVYYLFAEGTFLFLDGGTLDLGIVRDSTLVGTNDYRMFVETFEGLAKVGIESIKATVTTHITGANVGTVTPS